MQVRKRMCAVGVLVLTAWAQAQKPAVIVEKPAAHAAKDCREVTFEGDVKYGESFTKTFAQGLDFKLEAIASGWIVRVLPEGVARGPHDYAELATPPYQSVTPLAVSTDFAFRAQDAISWNPRRFRYAANAADAAKLTGLYAGVVANDPKASSDTARLVQTEPQGQLDILNAVLAPGSNDQWKMAAAVALHLDATPHQVAQGVSSSPLGRVEELRFRVTLELPKGAKPAPGVAPVKNPCRF